MNNFEVNPFEKFNSEWALVTAGSQDKFNSMTISWGSMGTLWHKKIVTIYVRPDRYTFGFLKDNDKFTVSFYDEKYKGELTVFGRKSGKDIDKVKETKFNPIINNDYITYKEAKETIVLKKIYMQQMDKSMFNDEALKCYPNDAEAHVMIIGEIIDYIK